MFEPAHLVHKGTPIRMISIIEALVRLDVLSSYYRAFLGHIIDNRSSEVDATIPNAENLVVILHKGLQPLSLILDEVPLLSCEKKGSFRQGKISPASIPWFRVGRMTNYPLFGSE